MLNTKKHNIFNGESKMSGFQSVWTHFQLVAKVVLFQKSRTFSSIELKVIYYVCRGQKPELTMTQKNAKRQTHGAILTEVPKTPSFFFFYESNLSQSSNWVITVINASAAVTLLEQRPEKIFRLWAGFEPTTSAIPVQCSPNWAIKATWERSYMG